MRIFSKGQAISKNIFNKESPFKLTAIALLRDKIAGYDLDGVLDSTSDRQQEEIWYCNMTMQIKQAHFTYRRTLELKVLYQHLAKTTEGHHLLCEYL